MQVNMPPQFGSMTIRYAGTNAPASVTIKNDGDYQTYVVGVNPHGKWDIFASGRLAELMDPTRARSEQEIRNRLPGAVERLQFTRSTKALVEDLKTKLRNGDFTLKIDA